MTTYLRRQKGVSATPSRTRVGVFAVVPLMALLVGSCNNTRGDATPSAHEATAGRPLMLGVLAITSGPRATDASRAVAESARFAVAEANGAGGVVGQPVLVEIGEADDPQAARVSVSDLLARGVQAVIGAQPSRISLAVVDDIVDAGRVQCSGGNTSPQFTTLDDAGLYFRAAPSDALQGPALARLVASAGRGRVGLVAANDSYGQGLADAFARAYSDSGGTVAVRVDYDPTATDFAADLDRVVGARPDAVVFVGESPQVLIGLAARQLVPSAGVGLYGGDALTPSALATADPTKAGIFDGTEVTTPVPSAGSAAATRFDAAFPESAGRFTPGTYDCVAVVVLAATQANSTDPAAFAPLMVDVTRGGTKCSDLVECLRLVRAGVDIDYDGPTNPADWSDVGEPVSSTYEAQRYSNGAFATITTLS